MNKISPDEIEHLIDAKIRQHEIRVALTSGAIGAALFAGIFHAIALLRHDFHT